MVTCLRCMKSLPYDCLCTESKRERLRNYLSQVKKELKLLESILVYGCRPKIKFEFLGADGRVFYEEICDPEIKELDEFWVELRVGKLPTYWAEKIIATLLDVENGKIVYRRECFVDGCETFTLTWTIGISRSGKKIEG